MEVYTVDDVSLSHDDFVKLRREGKVHLGMRKDDAWALLLQTNGPRKMPVNLATHLASWLAVGVFLASIYFSFTHSWWWFILGFLGMRVIWKAAKSALPDSYLDAAFVDKDFYESGRAFGVWLYQMMPEDARKYPVH
jgi:hypothetical protein